MEVTERRKAVTLSAMLGAVCYLVQPTATRLAQLHTTTRKHGLALCPDEEEEEKQISWTTPPPSTSVLEQGSSVSTHHKSAVRWHRLQRDTALAEHG